MKLLIFLDNVETCMACGGADIVRIIKFIWSLLEIVLFVIPIGLVVMIMVDFMKNVMAGKEDEMKKNLNLAIKRILYCVVLFLVPSIVSFTVGLVNQESNNIALQCIDLVTNNTAEDLNTSILPNCQVDYEIFGEEPFKEDIDVIVTFDVNDGSLESLSFDTKIVKYGEKYGPMPTVTRLGYSFLGWYTSKQDGEIVKENDIVKVKENQKLYARWGTETIKVTFDFGISGLATKYKIYNYGDNYGTLPNVPEKEGYIFEGWYIKKEREEKITADSKIEYPFDHTIYVRWKYNGRVVKCNANGGLFGEEEETITELPTKSDYYIIYEICPKTPTRENHEFLGWSYKNPNGSPQFNSSDTINASDIDFYLDNYFYAIWKKVS